MHLLFSLVSTVVICGGVIWGVASFLAPDDLASCSNGPVMGDSVCQPANVIVAISGGDTAARTREAVALYKAGWAPKLLFSGAALDTTGPSNAEAMRKTALESGVPASDVIIDNLASDTAANALHSAALLETTDRRIILVTSPYHQRRASLEFERALGGRAEVINHPASTDRSWGSTWWLHPGSWWLAGGEIIKTLIVMGKK